jgi:holo-[acyl-carrier protein] synthase
VIGLGLDLVPIPRVEALLARHGERALQRLFTEDERAYASGQAFPALHLAARLAAKEAAYKALNWNDMARGIGWREIEVARLDGGQPLLRLHGAAAARFAALGGTRCHLSLTHAGGMAGAVVVIE